MDKLLHSIRVLDLTDQKGLLCGRILADLGADVLKIEEPGGDKARDIGPFYHDVPDPEKSLSWFAYNLNKRGITLNIETADGQAIFKRLVEKADMVVESFPVGYMDKLGLGYSSLAQINPGMIMASISPFGQTGPYKDYKTSDIVNMAMGGYLYLCGDPDHPPLRVSIPQSYLHAASEAAVAVMMALYYRDRSGEGQWIDISIQQSLVMNTVQAIPFWLLNHTLLERSGAFRVGLTSGTRQRQTWPCKDGSVNYVIMGGRATHNTRSRLVKWMEEEGMSTEDVSGISDPDWDVFYITQEDWGKIEGPISRFFLTHTKAELLYGGITRGVAICPISSPADAIDYTQLKEREFWIEVEHPELNTKIKYPGFCFKYSETPCRVWLRPPLIGEHNIEVYCDELGMSNEEIVTLKEAGVI
jgi:crotonobetainyl-CoA:carnitine CoA-transferase CaiB-like acyl-CoA transferase